MGLMGLHILASSFRWSAGGKWLAGGFWLVDYGIIRRQRAFDSAQTQAGAGGFVGAGRRVGTAIIMRVLSVFTRVLSVFMYVLSVTVYVLSVFMRVLPVFTRVLPVFTRVLPVFTRVLPVIRRVCPLFCHESIVCGHEFKWSEQFYFPPY